MAEVHQMRRSDCSPADPAASPAGHYLKEELRDLLRTDPSVFEFFDAAIGDGLWFWDVTRPEEEWLSPRFKELFGYRDDEVPDTSAWWRENIFAEDLPQVVESFSLQCADPAHPYDQIVRYRHRDGSTVWVRCRGMAIRDAAGRAVRLLGAHTDLTAVKRAEQALRESEERFRCLVESSSDMITRFAPDGTLRYVSPTCRKLLGYEPEDLVGHPAREFIHPEDLDLLAWGEGAQPGPSGPATVTHRVRRRDGTWAWFETTKHAIVGPGTGDTVELQAASRDISDRRQVEEALRRSADHFRTAFEEGPLGTVIVTADGRFRRVNRRFCEMLGYEEKSLVGLRLAEVSHPGDAAAEDELVQRLVAGDIPHYQIEKRWIRRDGTTMWGRLTRTMVRSAAGEPFTLGLIEDTTAIHDAESSKREFDALQEAFLMVAAHDLRDPIAGMSGLVQVLIEDAAEIDPETQLSLLRLILAETDRMQGLVSRLLEAGRLTHGAVVATRRPTDLGLLIRRVSETIDPGAHPLEVDADPSGGAVVAFVDPALVERIVENLVRNAVGHTPPGTPIRVRAAGDGGGGAFVVVEDAGPGVTDDQKARIFERFHTGEGSSGGTGIGLWAVARLAELHGGRAWVEDRPGGGASFHVRFPAAPAEAVSAARRAS